MESHQIVYLGGALFAAITALVSVSVLVRHPVSPRRAGWIMACASVVAMGIIYGLFWADVLPHSLQGPLYAGPPLIAILGSLLVLASGEG